VLEQAAGTDPELAQLLESGKQEQLECARGVVAAVAATGSLRRDIPHEAAADMLWVQIQPSNYRRLVEERDWSHRAFERWHAAAMIAALLEPSGSCCSSKTALGSGRSAGACPAVIAPGVFFGVGMGLAYPAIVASVND
jgi:hypothetical protein